MISLKTSLKFVGLIVLSLLSLALVLSFGPASISNAQVAACVMADCENKFIEMVIWQVRIPRVLVGFMAGAGLAIAGAILQNTTRNPLADPYLFGIVSGAALGATIATQTLSDSLVVALPLAAFLGALFSVTIVLLISKTLQRMEQLLLAGVAVSFMLSSVSQLLLYLGDPFASNRVMFWIMGSLARVEMANFYVIAPVVLLSLIIVIAYARQIDALLLGDETATTLGVNVDRLRLLMMGICAALTATIVAYCGGIGFVGLMIPHIVRRWMGVTTLPLILGSVFIGGSFILWVDVLARSAFANQEIPIGIITSAIGS
ncbi:MAG: iron ABC transporter permease, partial [Psychrosphaera sp.]|nr:iron ABC transporter permease [Psychrosphaera sp.]